MEEYCSSLTNNWCKWNNDLSICDSNYDPIIFISAFDIAGMPKSLITYFIVAILMILYWFCGYLTRTLKIFKDIDNEKRNKCQIYIFELVGLTVTLIFLVK